MTQAVLCFKQWYITLYHVTNWTSSLKKGFLALRILSFCSTIIPCLCNTFNLEGLRSRVKPQLALEWVGAQGCRQMYLFSSPSQYILTDDTSSWAGTAHFFPSLLPQGKRPRVGFGQGSARCISCRRHCVSIHAPHCPLHRHHQNTQP